MGQNRTWMPKCVNSCSRAVYMAHCRCQSIQLPPSLKVYALQKKKEKGSIIFYKISPVALNREHCISILGVEDIVSYVWRPFTSTCRLLVWLKWPSVFVAVEKAVLLSPRLTAGYYKPDCAERRLMSTATGEIKRSLVGEEGSRPNKNSHG